jgi:iron complex outermembrane receptor protein
MTGKLTRSFFATSVLALAIIGLTPSTHAQTIDEIVVTAQKRLQALDDVPLVVSVLTADTIQEAGIIGLEDIPHYVPSLILERNTNPFTTTVRIRGVGNFGNIPNFEPAVGLFVDGAFRSRTGIGMADLLDVEQIEILHGPQSTLYGKNVTAGVVSVTTKHPTRELEGLIEASVGSDDEAALKGSIGGPLGDTVSGRLSASARSRDGLTYNLGRQEKMNGVDQYAVRGQLLFEPGDRLSILAIMGFSTNGDDWKCCAPDTLYGPVSTAFVTAITGQAPLDVDPNNRIIEHNDVYRFDGEMSEATLTAEYEFDSTTLTSLTSFDTYEFSSSIDAEQSTLDIWTFDDRQKGDTIGQEVRLTSTGGGAIEWMAGVYYYDNNFRRGSLDPSEPIIELGEHIAPVPLPGTPGDRAYFRGITDTTNISFFSQGTWRLTERFSVTAGARWFDEEKSFSVESNTDLAVPPSLASAVTVPASQFGNRTTTDIAWNFNVQFFAGDNLAAYVSVSRGVKGGGFNADWGALTLEQREFEDEEVLSYELGIKSSYFNRRLVLNAALFQSQYDNFQNASFLGVNFLVRSAEDVTTEGVELDLTVNPAEWLQMNVAATYLEAKYVHFSNGPCFFARPPDNLAEGTCVLDGESLPSAPKLRLTLGALGHWDFASGELYTRADWLWTDELQTNANLDPRSSQSSYGILNGRLGWRNERIDLSAWVRNLTDEDVVLASGAQALFGATDGGLQIFLNDPRHYGLTIRYQF